MSTLSTILAVVCTLTNIMWFFVFWTEHDDNNRSKRDLEYSQIDNSRLREENQQLKRRPRTQYVYVEKRPCNEFHQYPRFYR